MTRKLVLMVIFVTLLAADTAHFGSRCLAGILWLRGERALFRNDLRRAWRFDTLALSWGGDSGRIETDMVQLLVMGLDQLTGGFRPRLAQPADESLRRAFDLVARRISATPFSAFNWSQASDVYMHAGGRRRRTEVLDLSRLTDDPIDGLFPEERLGLAAQEIATKLEPNNYIYHDLLAQLYWDLGSPERAAPHCRRSIAAAPDTRLHTYLSHADLPGVILEAAVQGFEDASRGPSMMSTSFILAEAARTLSWHGDDRRAIAMLTRAVQADSNSVDAEMQLADANYRLQAYDKAIRHSRRAASLAPDHPSPHYTAGLSFLALGNLEPAIEEFREARERAPQEMRYFLILGQTLETAGRVKEAERQFVAAANRNPSAADAWASLLAFYVRQHDVKAALAVCSKLTSLGPGSEAHEAECASLESPR